MVKFVFSLNLLPLVFLIENLVSGESDARGGIEIPPENFYPQRHKEVGRNWESWTSPEGTLWYPGRIDYRMRKAQKGNSAGATPSGSDTHDTSTRRYFSLEEGPQFLSEHKIANSAHSQYGRGGIEGGDGERGSEQVWYPYGQHAPGEGRHLPRGSNGQYPIDRRDQYGPEEGSHLPRGSNGQYPVNGRDQYGPEEGSHLPRGSNGQYPVNGRDQYGSFSNGNYAGNVPYGQYFLNGQRVPDSVDPLVPNPDGDYMRGHYIPGHAGQGSQYVPEENGQFVPAPDQHYVPQNGDQHGIGPDGHYIPPDYGIVPGPNGGQNGHYLPENEPENYYIDGRDDYYPDSQYPYYYGEGDEYGQVDGDHGVYIPPGHPHDPNTFFENGQQPGGDADSPVSAGQQSATGHSVHPPNPDTNHMIFAGRDFLPVPTDQSNYTSVHRPDSLTNKGEDEHQVVPNLVHKETGIDNGWSVQNQSFSEGRQAIRDPNVDSGRDSSYDRRISESTTIVLPTARHPDTTSKQPTTPATTTTTAPKTTTTTTTTTPSTTTRSTPATTTLPSTTTPTTTTTTTRPIIVTAPSRSYSPINGRPAHYPSREHQRGQDTNEHIDPRGGMRPSYGEVLYPRRPHQRPTIPPVEIDLSKLMPEEEIHGPEDAGRGVDSLHHTQDRFPVTEQRTTLPPSRAREDERRRQHHPNRNDTHGTDTPNRPDHYTGGQQLYPRREQQPGRQHSSQTGSTGSDVGVNGQQIVKHDIIRQRQLPTYHEEVDQSAEYGTRQHTRGHSLPHWSESSRYEHGARTDQWPGRSHQPTPERRRHGSYQPINENDSFNYAAGRDRTHYQGQPEIESRRGYPSTTETRQQITDPNVDSTDESEYSGEGLPGISQRGTCPSVSQCRCCRWSTQQTRKTMECLQPKFKTVEVQVCTEEYNGVCVRTGRRKTLKPNGTEVRMCSKVQLKRSCFVCCPTFYPRGHNQTCNGVLDGIDKRGLRISVEADIGGFYQPPRLSKSTAHSPGRRPEMSADQASQQGLMINGQMVHRAHASVMAESEKGMVADQAANTQRICITQKMGANGQTITEKRPCSSQGELSMTAEEDATTAPCCLTREQLHNLFLRYCCGTKRYNGRQYSKRLCCGTKETAKKDNGRPEPLVKAPTVDMRQPQLTRNGNTEQTRTLVEPVPSRVRMSSESRAPMETEVSHMMEESEDADLETIETESQQKPRQFPSSNSKTLRQVASHENPESPSMRMRIPIDSTPRLALAQTIEESPDSSSETQKSVDTVRRRKCCPPGTRLRNISNGKVSTETQESLDSSSRRSSSKRNGVVLWRRVYSCCSSGNYLRKVACCLQRLAVSPLCCRKGNSRRR